MMEPQLYHRYERTELRMNKRFQLTKIRTIVLYTGPVNENDFASPSFMKRYYQFRPVNNPGWMPKEWLVLPDDFPLYNRQKEAKPGDTVMVTYQYKEPPSKSSLRKAMKQHR